MDKDTLAKVSAVALNNIFGFEPKFSHNLIDELGSAEAVFMLPEDEKLRIFGPHNRYTPRICRQTLEEASLLYEKLKEEGYCVCSIFDPDYPSLLKECPDAPVALYIRSGCRPSEIFNTRTAVAIVGTRDISPYGREWCRRIVKALSEAKEKPVIISGMAIGVDITAHRAAMECGLPTVGVLPVGIDDVYPRRHRQDAERISTHPGSALMTDYPPGTGATAFNFLRRNRIIAGIASSTLLIESKAQGGGTMTARLAFGYGRNVFALPGRVDDLRSEGCNRLIREKIAEPIGELGQLVEDLGLGQWRHRHGRDLLNEIHTRLAGRLSEEDVDAACRIAAEVRGTRGIDLDTLCRHLDLGYASVSALAGMLEAEGFISIDLLQRCTIDAINY